MTVLAVDILYRFVQKAQDLQLLKGFRINKRSDIVPNLQYADDTVFFIEAQEEEVDNLRSIQY